MMNFSYVLRRNAEKFPDKEFLVYQDQRYTYGQFHQRVSALAKGLQHIGLGDGDIVALLLYNSSQFLESVFAINRIGAVFLPLNYRLAGEELAYILNDAGAKAIITEGDFEKVVGEIKSTLPHVEHCITLEEEASSDWRRYDDLLTPYLGEDVPDAFKGVDDLHRIMYTSGTTSRPKGVMLTFGNLYWKSVGHIWELDIEPADRTLIVGPLYHCGGMDLPASGVVYRGGSLVIQRKFDAREAVELMESENITNIWLAPAMMNMILQEPSVSRFNLEKIRFIIGGGEKTPESRIAQIQAAFPAAWYADAYGLTETVSGDTFLDRQHLLSKLGSVGKPVIHLQVKILDDNDKAVAPGDLGEICLKGPKVFKGYWKNPQATAEAIRDGWFHTGDIGMIDADGYLYIMDRKKDMIISGGENIASPEIERVIYEHPQVLEAAVIGIPHERWGEVPKAFVALKPGASVTAEEIVDFCQGKLAKFKIPKEVEFIDSLPRNPSGKVLKRVLKDRQKESILA